MGGIVGGGFVAVDAELVLRVDEKTSLCTPYD